MNFKNKKSVLDFKWKIVLSLPLSYLIFFTTPLLSETIVSKLFVSNNKKSEIVATKSSKENSFDHKSHSKEVLQPYSQVEESIKFKKKVLLKSQSFISIEDLSKSLHNNNFAYNPTSSDSLSGFFIIKLLNTNA